VADQAANNKSKFKFELEATDYSENEDDIVDITNILLRDQNKLEQEKIKQL
jgi:hypothetical protein